jgi:hypothetical protein
MTADAMITADEASTGEIHLHPVAQDGNQDGGFFRKELRE